MHYLEKGHGKAEVPPPGWMERTLRGVEWNTSTRCYFSVCNLGCDLGRLLLTRSVGDGRGRAEEALGSKPSGLCPKPEDLAERSCRTAALSGTAAGTTSAQADIKPNMGASLACTAGAGRAPNSWWGIPFIAPFRFCQAENYSPLRHLQV